MATFTYFNGTSCLTTSRSSETPRAAAEAILRDIPAYVAAKTNARELLSIPLYASIDLTDDPQRTIRREA